MKINNKTPASYLKHLRQLAPVRPLAVTEANELAQRQARLLRQLTSQHQPRFDPVLLHQIPRIRIEQSKSISRASNTRWNNNHWLIQLDSHQSSSDQRLALLHEFKHIIDASLQDITYSQLNPQTIEQLSFNFAIDVLIPRHWLTFFWDNQVRNPTTLTQIFDAPLIAITRQLGRTNLAPTPQQSRVNHSPKPELIAS